MAQFDNEIIRNNNVLISKINEVPGFNPDVYAIEYTDLNTGECKRRLPFMPLLAWFYLKYPEGKIDADVKAENGCFVANAKVYRSYKDTPDQYMSKASASRSYCEDKPTINPREWAQTAAITIALRNAGFGLQFDMVSDDFSQAPIENSEPKDVLSAVEENESVHDAVEDVQKAIDSRSAEKTEVSVTDRKPIRPSEFDVKQAMLVPCPIKKYNGRTLGDLITLDPGALKWIVDKFEGDEKTKQAALTICEYALQNSMAG